jgi:hypothetical protein
MNIRKFNFWKTPTTPNGNSDFSATTNTATRTPAMQQQKDDANNVVSMPPRTPLDLPLGLNAPLTDNLAPPPGTTSQSHGLLNAPVLIAFFADNHFGLGRHNGANYRTQDALTLGKRTLGAKFQNALAELMAQKQAKADRLYDKLLETDGICTTTTNRLRQACANLEREITQLNTQVDLAIEGKGWVLLALNQFQIGFSKGLQEAVEFELLAD